MKVIPFKKNQAEGLFVETPDKCSTVEFYNADTNLHLFNLRLKPDVQAETREIVNEMLKLIKDIEGNPFEHTLKAWGYNYFFYQTTFKIKERFVVLSA